MTAEIKITYPISEVREGIWIVFGPHDVYPVEDMVGKSIANADIQQGFCARHIPTKREHEGYGRSWWKGPFNTRAEAISVNHVDNEDREATAEAYCSHYQIAVLFGRELSDDLGVIKDKYPGKDLGHALAEQLVGELSAASDEMGLAGSWTPTEVVLYLLNADGGPGHMSKATEEPSQLAIRVVD